jgi:dimethylglycine dehydrogenase
MLGDAGRLMGDLSIARLDDERFWLVASYYLQDWHLRWFHAHLPSSGVDVRNITDAWMGFSVSGPASRSIVAPIAESDLSSDAFPFFAISPMRVAGLDAVVGRIALTGELGYEIVVRTPDHLALHDRLREAGASFGLRDVGDRAVDSLRLEKGYGVWAAEFRQDLTPGESGLDRLIAWDKGPFVGRDAAARERASGPSKRLVLLEVDAADADASRDEGVWVDGRLVGFVTSGAYGHHVGMSLALAYVETEVLATSPSSLVVAVLGEDRPARVLPEPPYDAAGSRLRDVATSIRG